MGQIADDMIDGTCCALCGMYFVDKKVKIHKGNEPQVIKTFSHGYPVACNDCWEPDCGYQRQSEKCKTL